MTRIQICHVALLICLLFAPSYTLDLEDNLEDVEQYLLDEEKAPRVVDPALDELLRKILKSGIEGVLPPLDPLVLTEPLDVVLPEMSGALIMERLLLEDITLNGLSAFEATELSVNVGQLSVVFDLKFSLDAQSTFVDLDSIVGDFIPFYGNGTLDLKLVLGLAGSIKVGFESGIVIVVAIPVDINFGEMDFDMSNIMGYEGTDKTTLFNNVMSEVTPKILNLTQKSLTETLIPSLLEVINDFLRDLKLTLVDLLNCLNGKPSCPIQLP